VTPYTLPTKATGPFILHRETQYFPTGLAPGEGSPRYPHDPDRSSLFLRTFLVPFSDLSVSFILKVIVAFRHRYLRQIIELLSL
jgi:hypothetical protein